MATHSDSEHGMQRSILNELRLKAELMTELGKNRITAEKPLETWSYDGIGVQLLPDDPQGVLRISIGGHADLARSEYCNFRGDQGRCIALLERCLAAMKSHTP